MSHVIGKGRYARATYPTRKLTIAPLPGSLVSVETIAAASSSRLVDVNAVGMLDGTLAWVASVSATWVLRLDSALTPDGITVVDALGVAGAQWHRLESDYVFFEKQAVWHIDPAVGDDENDGLTALTALATFAELIRRWQFDQAELLQNTDVFIRSDLDPVLDARTRVAVTVGQSAYLRIIGVPTTVYTSNASAATQTNAATNTQFNITDAAMPDFDTYADHRISAGPGGLWPNTQRLTWVASVLALQQARLADCTLINTTPGAQSRSAFVFGAGPPIRIETLPFVNDLRIEVTQRVSSNPAIWHTVVQDVIVQAGSFDSWGVGALVTCAFVGCDIRTPVFLGGGESVFISCRFYSGFDGFAMSFRRGTARCTGCFFDNGIDVGVGALLFTEVVGSLVQDNSLSVSFGGMLSGTAPLGVFDSLVSGVIANPGSRVSFSSNIYGQGNQSYGWEHQRTAWATYTTRPTVTGIVGDLFVTGIRFSDANRASTWVDSPPSTLPGPVVQRITASDGVVAPALTITAHAFDVLGVQLADTVIVRFNGAPADLGIVGWDIQAPDLVMVSFLSVGGFNDNVDLFVSILPGG